MRPSVHVHVPWLSALGHLATVRTGRRCVSGVQQAGDPGNRPHLAIRITRRFPNTYGTLRRASVIGRGL